VHLITIYLHNEERSLRRERLFRDRLNPLEVYDYVEIRRLFRFQRENVYNIVGQLKDVLDYTRGHKYRDSTQFLRFMNFHCQKDE
jgi:hypothetical protein